VALVVGNAAALGAYAIVIGGAVGWARVVGAGLPVAPTLTAVGTTALLMNGLVYAAVVFPLAFVLLLMALQASDDFDRSSISIAWLGKIARIATSIVLQSTAIIAALLYAFLPTWGYVDALAWVSGVRAGTTWLPIALWLGCAGLAALVAWRVAPKAHELAAEHPRGLPRAIAAIVRTATYRRGRSIGIVASLLTFGAVYGALWHTDSEWAFVAAVIALEAWMTALLVLVFVRPYCAVTSRAHELAAEEDPGWYVLLLVVSVVAAALAPIWITVALGGLLVFIVLGTPLGLLPTGGGRPALQKQSAARRLFVTAAIPAVLIAVAGMAANLSPPQTFDRIDITISGQHVRAALLGEEDGDYVLAACDRTSYTQLGKTLWKSSRPTLLRVPIADAHDAAVVSGGYEFFNDEEQSLLGAILNFVPGGFGYRVAAWTPRPPGDGSPDKVCGGPAGYVSVERNLQALRSASA
jgi:hypothetical protein